MSQTKAQLIDPVDGSIVTADLADDAVNADKLASNSVVSDSIVDGSIVNGDINASAAIAGTKVAPDFGSQAVTTTGNITGSDITANGGDLTISGSTAVLHLTDTNNDDDFSVMNENGTFIVRDATNSANRLSVNSSGVLNIPGNTDFGAGIDVTGNITVSGTVDGVDIAALNTTVGTKVANIVEDTSPQLGGDLDTNSFEISLDDNHAVKFGDNADCTLKHDGYSSIQIAFSDASTSVSAQVPPGVRILNNSNTNNGLTGLYFASAGGQANVGIFAKQKDSATQSSGQGCDMFFFTKANGASIMDARAKFTNTGHFEPAADSTYNIGGSSNRFANGYFDTLYGDGSNLTGISSGGGFTSSQQFTSNGTWTKPSGINKIRVYVTGGGGGAGGGGSSGDFGAAGGAGGTAIEIIDVSSVSSVTVTIGAAGSGGSGDTAGSAGGTTSFGSYCSATGGGGGQHGNFGANSGGQGGVGSGGDINLQGGDGGTGQDNSGISTQYASSFGVGGASYWGGGGGGHSHSYAPQPGRAYGSGGGATHNDNYNQGAAGKAGFVYVEQYT